MKVMMVITDSRRGGTPNKLAAITRTVSRRGWDTSFVTVMPEGAIARGLAKDGVTTESLGVNSLLAAVRSLFRLRRLISRADPDVIQTALWHANLLGRLAAIGTGIPVLNAHEAMEDEKSRLRVLADRYTHRFAVGHTAVSRAVAERIRNRDGIPASKIAVVYNGIDPEAWRPRGRRDEIRKQIGVPADAKVVGWVGRFVEEKNIPALIRLAERLPEWWVILAGYGPLKQQAVGLARDLGVEDRVRFLEETSNVPALFEAFDVYCLTSHSEGFPMALLEAMAMALPIVATRVGGVPELIEDGVEGLLVPNGDVDAVADAVLRADAQPEMRERATRTVRARFTEEQMCDRYVDAWMTVVG